MSKLLIGESLRYGQADTPTREGEVINYLEDIYNIPTPFVGMGVYCKQTGKTYTITSLASEIIGGEEVFNKVGTFEAEVKDVTWVNVGNVSNMNDFTEAGVYDIKGEHTRIDDNLPILNIGGGHSFNARLTVLDSSIAPEGQSDDICITQKLTLSNRVAGDGDVYIRTGRGASKEAITWETWGKLQQNIEVGQVATLDNLIDNGIYSGVLKKGPMVTDYETFVLVVINDYAVTGEEKRVSQFKYGLNAYGEPSYESRYSYIPEGYNFPTWSDWEILNKNEISSMISAEIKKVTDGIDPKKIDSIKDIIAWIEEHGGEVEAIYNAIEANTKKINEEIERSGSADRELLSMIDAEQRRAEQAEEELDKKIDNIQADITAEDTQQVVESIEENVVATALRKTPQVLTESEKQQARTNIDAQKELTLAVKDNGNIVIGNLQGETKEFMPATPSGDPMHYAYIAAGAEYNNTNNVIMKTAPWGDSVEHLPKHWYLNGLGDITNEQMMAIYNAPHGALYPEAYSSLNIRTSIYKKVIGYGSVQMSGAFVVSKIEVFGAKVENIYAADATSMFTQCSKLKYCIPIIDSKKTSGAFTQCPSLIVAKIRNLAVATSFAHSAQISKDSILFSIQNAAPTSAITITLHADAYARLKDDVDIVAALAAQPLVTIVSA